MVLVGACAAVLAGAVVRGYSGFGASMFWVASLSLLYTPVSVVPTVLALEVLASLALAPAARRDVDWRSMGWLLAGTAVTTPAGIALLAVVPEQPMRVLVALSVMTGTVALACGVQAAGSPRRRTSVLAGTVCGVVNGSTGIGGPPAVLLYFSGGTAHQVGRATLIVYFLAMDALGLALMGLAGLVDQDVAVQTFLFAPLALLGILAGQAVFRRSSGRRFRGVVLAVLAFLSLAVLAQALL